MYEAQLIVMLCQLVLGGEPEVNHPYQVGYDLHRIRVDCETPTHVIEVGRDKRSSLDSVQQALFAAQITGKEPMVVLVDSDGREREFEYRIRTVSEGLGIEYRAYTVDDLVHLQLGS